ncbi:MAG: hypothetical protein KDA71_14115, partial [Planctomycetales bacterium]|nr:hypothetical protein [Planctomycetales bacterium]
STERVADHVTVAIADAFTIVVAYVESEPCAFTKPIGVAVCGAVEGANGESVARANYISNACANGKSVGIANTLSKCVANSLSVAVAIEKPKSVANRVADAIPNAESHAFPYLFADVIAAACSVFHSWRLHFRRPERERQARCVGARLCGRGSVFA